MKKNRALTIQIKILSEGARFVLVDKILYVAHDSTFSVGMIRDYKILMSMQIHSAMLKKPAAKTYDIGVTPSEKGSPPFEVKGPHVQCRT